MKILVLGGDGFCGWATSLRLARSGHDVVIVDNLCRRKIDLELGTRSLTPIAEIRTRVRAWNENHSTKIRFVNLDLVEQYAQFLRLLLLERPDTIVHFAEQRSAPYSMRSSLHKRYTVGNNVTATHNVMCAVVESGLNVHIVHLGTMGVYGYDGGAQIPEGYQVAKFAQPDGEWIEKRILYPADPGSIYHMTKTLDQLIFYFYNKNDRVRITDLHQGIVWGTTTPETDGDLRLINRFDYDGEFGTVLNRFLVQATIGHPLTVYGTGGQTRAFIHIRDSVECVRLAVENPPVAGGDERIFNQLSETHRVRDLAAIVSKICGVPIANLPNPRNEAAENELLVSHSGLRALGFRPTLMADALLEEVVLIAQRFSARIDAAKFNSSSNWNSLKP